ncbi:MAG TPA: ATP-binding cassette domain-containing protein [Aquabacterium sp.]|nr:ATP-binding cassette domain-containing protein [Aquabacterium sp.]HQC96575.1 ATP-binding cassette domain-containing protein [Aquabacterium sp.]
MAEAAPALRLQGLGKTWPGVARPALQGVDLDLPAGAITVVMGQSGSGKSTLLRLVNRLVEPTAGRVLCGDVDVTALTQDALRRWRQQATAMVFQRHALLPHHTVLQNVAWPLRLRGTTPAEAATWARHWLQRVGLADVAAAWPAELSGGMQQRVGLARALAADAPLLLLDEPFSALDPLHRTALQDLLLGLQAELRKTVVFVTHDLDEALRLADHLVLLREGRVLQQGQPALVVLQPADDHVAAFLRGLHRGRRLRCGALARPGAPVAGPALAAEATLAEAAHALLDAGARHANLVAADGRHLGTLALDDLVRQLAA